MSGSFTETVKGVRKHLLHSFLVGNWRYGGCCRVVKYLVVNVGFILLFLLGFTTLLPMAT
jgi:hypothetical protein